MENLKGQTGGRDNEGFLEEQTQKGHVCPIGIGQVRNWAQELSSHVGDDSGNVQPNCTRPRAVLEGSGRGQGPEVPRFGFYARRTHP